MWIDDQPNAVLREWLKRTKTPMLATLANGQILWCNQSFERYLGYSVLELVGKITWKELTPNAKELEVDEKLVEQCISGERTEYWLQKPYQHKNGENKPTAIEVLRYPVTGEIECFLVAAIPINRTSEFAMGQLTEIRETMLQLLETKPTGLTFSMVMAFCERRPIVAAIICMVVSALVLGDRVTEIIRAAMATIGK